MIDRTQTAFRWQLFSNGVQSVTNVIATVILARLLAPEVFGEIAAASVVIGAASLLSEAGIVQALIYRRPLHDADIRVGFTLSVGLGIAFALTIAVAAPLFGFIPDNDSATAVIRLLAATFAIQGFSNTAYALLQRSLRFRAIALANCAGLVVGYFFVGVPFAVMGLGVWSLAWAMLAEAVVRSTLFLLLQKHPKRPMLRGSSVRGLLGYAVGAASTRAANYAANHVDYVVIGRTLGAEPLGLYHRAYQIMSLPVAQLSSGLTAVLFPALCEMNDDLPRLRHAYLRAVGMISLIVAPLLAVLGVAGHLFARVVLGPEWEEMGSLLRILCIGGLFRALYNVADAVARALGAVYRQSVRHAIYAALVFLGAAIGSRWGLSEAAWGAVGALALMYLMMAHLTIRMVRSTWRQYLAAQGFGILAALITVAAGAATMAVGSLLEVPDPIRLPVMGILSASTAIGVTLLSSSGAARDLRFYAARALQPSQGIASRVLLRRG